MPSFQRGYLYVYAKCMNNSEPVVFNHDPQLDPIDAQQVNSFVSAFGTELGKADQRNTGDVLGTDDPGGQNGNGANPLEKGKGKKKAPKAAKKPEPKPEEPPVEDTKEAAAADAEELFDKEEGEG